MAIRYVAGISWPRSGHHLMERLLRSYFGPDFVYCDFYPEARDCCRVFPCNRPNVHFSKNHDFGSSAVPKPGIPYLIQYRGVMAAAVSDFELYLRSGEPDTPERFEHFATVRARGWGEFVRKWVDNGDGLERCILRYEDLTADPMECMATVIRFFSPSTEVDRDRLNKVLASIPHQLVTKSDELWIGEAGVKQFRRVEDFRFYDADLFQRIEAVAESVRKPK